MLQDDKAIVQDEIVQHELSGSVPPQDTLELLEILQDLEEAKGKDATIDLTGAIKTPTREIKGLVSGIPKSTVEPTGALAAAEQAKSAEEAKAKALADEQAKIAIEEKARVAAEQAKLAAEEQTKALAAQQAKLAAEEAAKAEAAEQARLAAEEQAKAEAAKQAKLAAEEQAKAEAAEQAKLAAEEQAKAEQAKAAADIKTIQQQKALEDATEKTQSETGPKNIVLPDRVITDPINADTKTTTITEHHRVIDLTQPAINLQEIKDQEAEQIEQRLKQAEEKALAEEQAKQKAAAEAEAKEVEKQQEAAKKASEAQASAKAEDAPLPSRSRKTGEAEELNVIEKLPATKKNGGYQTSILITSVIFLLLVVILVGIFIFNYINTGSFFGN